MQQSKFTITCIISIILLMLFSQSAFSQTYIDVVPGFSTLNDAVTANTTPNVVFRLQRGSGAIYLLNGSLTTTVPVSIQAADGTGARPQLIPAIGSGGVSDIPIRVKANLTMKGVYVAAKDEGGAYLSQIIRVQADGMRLILDDCFLENSAQSAIRLDNKDAKIYLTRTTVRNCASDYANGRGIDDRGVNIDTLYLENNTIYNIASRFLRDGGGYINYFYANHNTFANNGTGLVEIGECPKVVFKNNMVVNCGFIGQGKAALGALLQLKPLTNAIYSGVTQSVEVHNNNFYLDPASSALYRDTVVAIPSYNAQMITAIAASNSGENTISNAVVFTSAPPSVSSLVTAYWNDPLLSSSTTATGIRATGTYDFGYPTTAASYSKGTFGQPLGSLTWFNTLVGVKENNEVPTDFILSQNYPNPFNPTTNIRYSIRNAGMVRIDIFNSLGQRIDTIVNIEQNPGQYVVTWNGKNMFGQDVASGIYLYKISANNYSQTKKMMLIK